MEKGMTQAVQCKSCKNNFIISNVNVIHEKQFKDKDGQTIYITYFDCPHCQDRHYVQVDNNITLKIKKECLDMFASLAKIKMAKKRVPIQQRNKFDSGRKKLSDKRFELIKQYEDSMVTDTETGAEIHINFTVM